MEAPLSQDPRDRPLAERAAGLLGAGLQPYAVDDAGLPLLARSGRGACFVDVTGRQFIDWNMGFGSLLLGYRHPEVDAAVREQLTAGMLFSVPHALEVEVAEQLVAMIPGAERVAFGKNGSDVCAAAVRVARAVTGRQSVLQFGYHGFHDWCAALNPAVEGVPEPLRPMVYPLPYNDLDGLQAILHEHGADIAAVIMEPFRAELPAPGFLAGVRKLTRDHGALLIFDEMVTGFRIAKGGAQERFGVRADLACFGKALSNGLPLAALVGAAGPMAALARVGYGMTARGETLALAAARAALVVYAREPVAAGVAEVGLALREGFAASCARLGVAAWLYGDPAMQGIALPPGWDDIFLRACRADGVFTNGHLLPGQAHGDAEVAATCRVFEAALETCLRELGRDGHRGGG
jgi:glutamate-1-semialdehyde 2,1-aminomutase